MSVVAVTGARGFLGQHATAELENAGHRVIRIGRDDAGAMHRVGVAPGEPLFEGVDAVIHLAAQLVSGPNIVIADYLDANVNLTERMLVEAHDAGVGRFVFASSRLVYPGGLGRDAAETDAAPDNAYGMSKWIAEHVVAYHANRTGMSAVSLRISQLVGPGDNGRGVLGGFARAAARGGPLRVAGTGRAVRDFLDVRDAARALRSAVEHATVGGVLNIGGGGRTIRELAAIAAEAFGLGDGAIEHTDVDHDDRTHWALDCTRAAETMGWRPAHQLSTTLRDRWPELAR